MSNIFIFEHFKGFINSLNLVRNKMDCDLDLIYCVGSAACGFKKCPLLCPTQHLMPEKPLDETLLYYIVSSHSCVASQSGL